MKWEVVRILSGRNFKLLSLWACHKIFTTMLLRDPPVLTWGLAA